MAVSGWPKGYVAVVLGRSGRTPESVFLRVESRGCRKWPYPGVGNARGRHLSEGGFTLDPYFVCGLSSVAQVSTSSVLPSVGHIAGTSGGSSMTSYGLTIASLPQGNTRHSYMRFLFPLGYFSRCKLRYFTLRISSLQPYSTDETLPLFKRRGRPRITASEYLDRARSFAANGGSFDEFRIRNNLGRRPPVERVNVAAAFGVNYCFYGTPDVPLQIAGPPPSPVNPKKKRVAVSVEESGEESTCSPGGGVSMRGGSSVKDKVVSMELSVPNEQASIRRDIATSDSFCRSRFAEISGPLRELQESSKRTLPLLELLVSRESYKLVSHRKEGVANDERIPHSTVSDMSCKEEGGVPDEGSRHSPGSDGPFPTVSKDLATVAVSPAGPAPSDSTP
jgi:hypothetical protein